MLSKLHRKFVAVVMLVSTLLLCILLMTIYQSMAASLRAESLRMMESVEQGPRFSPFSPDADSNEPRLYYFVLSRDMHGHPIVRENVGYLLTDNALVEELYQIAAASPQSDGVIEEYALRYLRISNFRGDRYVFADISDELSILDSMRRGCAGIGLLSLLVIFVTGNLLVRWMIRPVEESWIQQKQFVADASHELKTPLTVIMTNAELLTSADYSDNDKAKLVDGISVMTVRMRQLIDGMLDLARVDSGVVKSAFASVNYSELVEQSLLPFEPAYFESGRTLDSHIQPGLSLRGSARHLAQVTDILLDNAMKYSFDGATIRLTLQKQGRHALLCVASPGPSLSPQQCKDIFLRFYVVDKARTGDSYGLGLSIAQAIVEEHGGSIWAESSDGDNRFYVKLPL